MAGRSNVLWNGAGGAPVAGLAFCSLIIVGFFLPQAPVASPSGREIADYLGQNRISFLLEVLQTCLAALVILWFAAGLRSILRRFDNEVGYLSTLSFGGASVLFATLLGVAAVSAGLAGRLPADTAITEALWYVSRAGYVLVGFPTSVFVGAAAILMLRLLGVWRWLGILGIAAAVLELVGTSALLLFIGPLGFLGFLLTALWILATSIAILSGRLPAVQHS